MQFSTLALLSSSSAAVGALALPSGPVATGPIPTLTVHDLTWNTTTADTLQLSFNIHSSYGSDGEFYCSNSTVQWDETLVCASNPAIKFGFVPSSINKFEWFDVYWTFPAGALTDDGAVYLAHGANSIERDACSATADGQQCVVRELSMQGRTTVVTN